MNYYKLTHKNPRGFRILAEAGTGVDGRWVLIEKRLSVAHCERPGPWLLLRPDAPGDFHRRWVHESEDTYFVCSPAQ